MYSDKSSLLNGVGKIVQKKVLEAVTQTGVSQSVASRLAAAASRAGSSAGSEAPKPSELDNLAEQALQGTAVPAQVRHASAPGPATYYIRHRQDRA